MFAMNPDITRTAHEAAQARDRIRAHIYQTPLIPARSIGKDDKSNVLFKAENFQLTGSFKLRGAMSKMSAGSGDGRLITASSGNHGIGAACASRSLGKHLTVVLPENVVPSKLAKIQSYGAEVIVHGAEAGLAEQHAQYLASSTGDYTYISPYNDADIIAGQGTIGLEILEHVLKTHSPKTRVYGVSATNSKSLADSMAAGRVIETEHKDTLAEAVAGGIDNDTITLPLAKAVIDHVVECDEAEIQAALKELAFEENMIVEGAAALALAGFHKVAQTIAGQTTVIVLCGANYNRSVVTKAIYAS
ncbi:hypothetical protein Q7P37_008751 [Cladosporium fusiforme]